MNGLFVFLLDLCFDDQYLLQKDLLWDRKCNSELLSKYLVSLI